MGISQVMQPRAVPGAVSEGSSTASSLAGSGPTDTSNGSADRSLVPAVADSPIATHDLPSEANRKYGVTPRKRKPRVFSDHKLQKVVGLILVLKMQGKSRKEIADELGLTENTVQTYLYRARKKGYLDAAKFDNPNDIIDTIIKPKVVENIEKLLDWRHPKTNLPSMDMTVETAKGVGIFQQHTVNKGPAVVPSTAFALKVQVIMPPASGTAVPEARIGTMGGRQAVEGEVLETTEDDHSGS